MYSGFGQMVHGVRGLTGRSGVGRVLAGSCDAGATGRVHAEWFAWELVVGGEFA